MNKKTWTTLALALMLMCLAACKPQAHKTEVRPFVMPDPADVVMYQVNPRVFAAQQSLRAVTARIDSISELGVNVIWVMPIYPIGQEKSKNSPYSIKDYCAIAPEFGTIADLQALVDSCHQRGMGLILDWVANHTAWDHPWVKQHPEWYTHDEQGNIIYPAGTDWTDVADLNYDNSDMRAAMIAAMKFWVDSVGVDGFRCDVADGVPADFWTDAINALRNAAAPRQLLMLAEGNRTDNFTAGFDMNYAWDYLHALERVFESHASANSLFDVDKREYDSIPAGKYKLRFTTNHDESTKATPIGRYGGERASMAAFVAATMLHGGMLVYGSQEVGYAQPINFFHYVPVNWMANGAMRAEYIKLIDIYNAHPALRGKGTHTAYDDEHGHVLIFDRTLDDENILVLVNTRDAAQQVVVPGFWRNRSLVDLVRGDSLTLDASITLAPYAYRLLQLCKP